MPHQKELSRRGFLGSILRYGTVGVLGLSPIALGKWRRLRPDNLVWQIDPQICIQCGNCATACVLKPSAVKCVHNFEICGRCNVCFGYFDPKMNLTTAAESELCPLGAIKRTHIAGTTKDNPCFEYTIDEKACIGCSRCIKGCTQDGNGSLYLQVRHDRCLNCNQCNIARACPVNAFRRVPASQPYIPNVLG